MLSLLRKFSKDSVKSQLSDMELIDKFKSSGDQLFVVELYKRYSKHIAVVCLSYIKDENLCKDIIADVYLKIVNDLGNKSFDDSQRFKNWIAVITKNHCISIIRSKKIEGKVIDRNKNIESLNNYMEFDDTIRYNNEITSDDLKIALNSLKTGQKHCIELFFFNSYKITPSVLNKIEKKKHLQPFINKLKRIQNIEFHGNGFFYDKLKSLINTENGEYISEIINQAFYSQSKSYSEICEITGYSYNEVKSHLQTGRINLMKKLKNSNSSP